MIASADNGWELRVSRIIAAPPVKVWEAMTQRQSEWFCPAPWRAEVIEQDWRAGGRNAMIFHGPDGEKIPQEGLFIEVVPGVRFVTTDAFMRRVDGGIVPHTPFMIGGWEIASAGEATRYTAWARHWSEEAMQQHAAMGFDEGWKACADGLAALVERG